MTHANAPLERTLTLRDLVLLHLVAVISLASLSAGARTGPGVLTIWVAAALLFFLPQGLAVVALSAAYPNEGGIYAWTKREFGEGHGFVCGWCYWVNNVLFFPSVLLSGAVIATYAIGKGGTALADDWGYALAFTLGALAVAAVLNVVGVGTGRWLQNAGGIGVYFAVSALIVVGLVAALTHPPANGLAPGWWKPRVNDVGALNLWATIPFAYAGLELAGTMGGEVRDPERTLPRSIYIAAPLIALVHVLGSAALLWLVPAADVNVAAGVFQGVAAGAAWFGRGFAWLAPLAAGCAVVGRLGGLGAWLSGSARLAFVVGLDRYFPPAFGRVHPRWHTPYVAILVEVALAAVFLLLSILGKGTTVGTAFLTLLDMSLLLYFVPYVYLFACYVAYRRRGGAAGTGQPRGKGAATAVGVSGLLVTVFAMLVATVPPPDTADPVGFVVKVMGGTLALVGVAGVIYWRARRPAPVPAA